ncbi:hypothetical protein GCM10009780_75930 [Actinomadura alba]
MIKKRGRNLRAGQTQAWTEEWFNGHGLHRLRVTIRCPGSVTMSRRSSVSRMRENRTYGIERGMGKRAFAAPRP